MISIFRMYHPFTSRLMKPLVAILLVNCMYLTTWAQPDLRWEPIETVSIDILTSLQDKGADRYQEASRQGYALLDSNYEFVLDPAVGFWEKDKRSIYAYPTPTSQTTITDEWNAGSLGWDRSSREVKTVDPSTGIEDIIEQEWDASSASWTNDNRTINEFNPQGWLLRFTHLYWSNNQWQGLFQVRYNYTGQGRNFIADIQNWNGSINAWETNRQDSAVYNSVGKLEFVQGWDVDGQNRIPNFRLTYTFDNQELLTQRIREEFTPSTQQWIKDIRWFFSYDASENRTSFLRQTWEAAQGLWENDKQELYEYDANGNRTSEIDQNWDLALLQWLNDERNTYAFNSNDNLELHIVYSPNADDWEEQHKIEYYWTVAPTALSEAIPHLACEIPNPIHLGQSYRCSDLDPSKTYSFLLIDLSGRHLQQQSLQGGDAFFLNRQYPKGLYLLLIKENGRFLYQKKIQIE